MTARRTAPPALWLAVLFVACGALSGCLGPTEASTQETAPVLEAPREPAASPREPATTNATPPTAAPANLTPPAPEAAAEAEADNATAPGNVSSSNATAAPVPTLTPGLVQFHLEHAGNNRTAKVYVPPNLPVGKPVPLLVLLHGGTGNPDNMMWKTMMQPAADAGGFLILAPQGMPSAYAENEYRWQAFGSGLVEEDYDDAGFILRAINWTKEHYAVDAARVGAAGHSEGGMMAYAVGVADPDVFRFVGAVAGTVGQRVLPARPWNYIATPTEPMNVLIVHATDDPQVPYEGGRGYIGIDPWVKKASVAEAIAKFTTPFAGINATVTDDGEVQFQLYRDNASDHRVLHVRTVGGHGWPAGIESTVFPYSVLVGTPPRPDTTALVVDWLLRDLP